MWNAKKSRFLSLSTATYTGGKSYGFGTSKNSIANHMTAPLSNWIGFVNSLISHCIFLHLRSFPPISLHTPPEWAHHPYEAPTVDVAVCPNTRHAPFHAHPPPYTFFNAH